MANQDLTISFLTDKTPKDVFNAINNVRGWWGIGVEGGTEKLNDEFIYRHKGFHYSKHKLVEVVPGKKVVWLTTDGQLNFVKDKREWVGSRIVFDIAEKDGTTEFRFTHEGLRPDRECYKDCSNGWAYYIGSLKELIMMGKGTPDPVETAQVG